MRNIEIDVSGGMKMRGVKVDGGRQTPIICLHGLTRNAADFEDALPFLAATGRDVYAFSFRGRGLSDYDPDYRRYFPTTYRDDVLAALEQLGLARAIFLGTSLGGIVAMLLAASAPARVAAAIINDVGPELAPEGIARIAGYVGARSSGDDADAPDLDGAVARIRAINEVAFPGRDREFWRTFARRTFRQTPDGAWRLDYDPNIGRALLEAGPAPDLWPAFGALRSIPTLVMRGALSDLLSPAIIDKMRAAHPDFAYAEIAGVGHAPTLSEPDARKAIDAFLQGLN